MLTPFLLLLLAQSAQSDEAEVSPLSCGPFLLQPGTHGMTIVVDHATPVATRLCYWTEGGDELAIEHEEPARHHVFTLEGLAANTAYSYEITGSDLSTGTHSFRTLPERPERYRVLAVGDVRTYPEAWARVSGRMFEDEPDALFAIGTGDYPADGRNYNLWIEQFFAPARPLLGHLPLWPAIGNHELTRRHDDVTNIENSHYFSLFELPGNERWFRVDYHLMTLLVVDSNSLMTPEEAQYQWLRDQLRSPRNRFTLVALHHAPLTSGPHGALQPDGTPVEWPLDQGRRFLLPLFEMYGVDLVLTGHDHLYERSEKDGVVYVVTGGGGAPLYPINAVENPYQQVAVSAHHYVALDVDANGIEVTAINIEGEVIDNTRVEATEEHVERRTRSVTSALEQAVQFGSLDPATHVSVVALSNPLDHPLTVGIATASGGNKAEPIEETLAPGERREVSWPIQGVEADLLAEPWRAPVMLDLRLHFAGQDQALDVDLDLLQKATVYRPAYSATRLDSVVADGDYAEWDGLPAMMADEQTPIVKTPASHKNAEDFGAEVKLAWTNGWLHVLADVTDEKLVDDGTSFIDKNDCLRLLVDLEGSRGATVFTFSAAGRVDEGVEAAGILHAVKERDGGWVLEASLPWEALGMATEGDGVRQVACDFLFVDRDIEEEQAWPSYHRFWTNSRSRFDTSTFGIMTFAE